MLLIFHIHIHNQLFNQRKILLTRFWTSATTTNFNLKIWIIAFVTLDFLEIAIHKLHYGLNKHPSKFGSVHFLGRSVC